MLNPERSMNRRFADRIAAYRGLDPLATAIQGVVQKLLAAGGAPVRNLLHGTWLGHPLHPLITDVPTGAWTVALALDLVSVGRRPSAERGSDRGNERGADAAIAVGIVGAVGAAAAGWADWSDTADDPKALGLAHALLNGGALGLYTASFAARRSGRRGAGIGLALGGYALLSFAGYLGGELTFGMQLGVKHTAIPIDPDAAFTPVMNEDDLPYATLTRVDLAGVPVLVLRTQDGIHAIGAACTHRGAPLDEGTLEGTSVRCPWHGSLFDLRDGRALDGPASFPQPRFEGRVHGGKVELRPLAPR
jgi:nitrite reductase/ring-hydroxylating ferredoxin subunit/uncharacterized membrane protein